MFYRINVIELAVPALKNRGDDVLLLAQHILERLGHDISILDDGAKTALLNYTFPGNVRELENILERAVTLCSAGTIRAGDLAMRSSSGETASETTANSDLGNQIVDVQTPRHHRGAGEDPLQQDRSREVTGSVL